MNLTILTYSDHIILEIGVVEVSDWNDDLVLCEKAGYRTTTSGV